MGYDFLKIHGDFSREAYGRLFEVSRREGMIVIGHAPRNLGIEVLLEERQGCLAHAEEYLYAFFLRGLGKPPADRETQQKILKEQEARIPGIAQATARAGTWVIPNLTAFKGIARQAADIRSVLARPEVRLVPESIRMHWQPERNTYVRRFGNESAAWLLMAEYELLEKLVIGLRDAGVRLLAGTDAPIPSVVPGYSLHDELQDLVAAGLTPFEALQTATSRAAQFLRGTEEFGVIAVGMRADLVLLNANPLEAIEGLSQIDGLMVRGAWLPADVLKKLPGQNAVAN